MNLHFLLDFRLTLIAAVISVVVAMNRKFRESLTASSGAGWITETTMYCWALEASLLTIRFCESWSINVEGDPKSIHWDLLVGTISKSFLSLVLVIIVVVANVHIRSRTFSSAWRKATLSVGVFIAFVAVLVDWCAVFFFEYIARFYLN